MRISNYHGHYTGAGQTVVIIDSGMNSNLFPNDNVVYQYDFADNDANAEGTSTHGGIVASVAQEVASGINIIHLKVFGDNSQKTSEPVQEKAFQWIIENADRYNVVAVNMSIQYKNTSSYETTELTDEYETLDNMGIVTTIAAGNSGTYYDAGGISIDAASKSVIAVSATNKDNKLTLWTQKHPLLTDICAFGQDIPVVSSHGHTVYNTGTSFAAPIVAAAVALVQEAAMDLLGHRITDEQFLDLIQKTADPIDPTTYTTGLPPAEKISPDTDPGCGVDAYKLNPTSNKLEISGALGKFDKSDGYVFTLDEDATVRFNLSGLDSSADLILFDSSGNLIAHEWKWSNSYVSFAADLKRGQAYHILVDSYDNQSTKYNLSIDFNGGIISNQTISPNTDDPGENRDSACVLHPTENKLRINDSVGGHDKYWYPDRSDYYAFTLDNDAEVSFDLTGLSDYADIILKDSYGVSINHSWGLGLADCNITADLEAGQTYYIVVAGLWNSGPTDYNLSINFNGGIDTDLVQNISPNFDPGTNEDKAYVLDPTANRLAITDTVGGQDSRDSYAFTLDNDAEVSFNLSGLSSGAGLVFLHDSFGNYTFPEWEKGNYTSSLTTKLEAGQTYYVSVDSRINQQAEYDLFIDFNGGININNTDADADADYAGYAGINIDAMMNHFTSHLSDYE